MLLNYRMATIDLEDAYLLVPMHPSCRKFLRFQLKNKVYEFTFLPFSLAVAPYIFTNILRPVFRSLREEGFQSIVYLDDFLFLSASQEDCKNNVQAFIELLSSLGFLINYSKSQLLPLTKCKYLGFIFDSVYQLVSISVDKKEKLFALTQSFAQNSHCTIRDFAALIGSLMSIFPAVQYSLLYTKRFKGEKFLTLESHAGDFSKQMTIPAY